MYMDHSYIYLYKEINTKIPPKTICVINNLFFSTFSSPPTISFLIVYPTNKIYIPNNKRNILYKVFIIFII